MAPFAEELKTSKTSGVQVGKPGEEAKDIKNAVRNAVRGYADTVKQWDKDTEKHIVEAKSLSKLFPGPDQGAENQGALLALIFALVVALAATGALGFLFTREAALRKQTAVELELARDEQLKLEQSVVKLRSDAQLWEGQIQGLKADLDEANQKAAFANENMRVAQEAEMIRVKNFYEAQIEALKGVVRMRDQWAQSFGAQLEAIRRILERGAVSASVGAVVPPVVAPVENPAESGPNLTSVPTGQILAVDYVNRFIVTNLGPAQGAKAGGFIQVYHDQEYLGQARIDRTYQDLSAATIVSDDLLEQVKEGDKAFLGLV